LKVVIRLPSFLWKGERSVCNYSIAAVLTVKLVMRSKLFMFFTILIITFLCMGCSNNKDTYSKNVEPAISELVLHDSANQKVGISASEPLNLINSVTVSDIIVVNEPLKLSYLLNEEPDYTGLNVICCYSNGCERLLINEEMAFSTPDMSLPGTKEVCVSFRGQEANFSLEVLNEIILSEPETKYSTTSLNLRSGPGTSYDAIKQLSLNDEVSIIGRCDNGWVRVIFKEFEYYCSEKYLSDEKIEVAAPNTDMSGLVFDGNISEPCRNKAIELYGKVPQNVKNAITASGFRVIVTTNTNITWGHAGLYHPFGCYCCGGGNIGINAASLGKINMSLIHEIGHFVDNYCGQMLGTAWNENYQGVSSSAEFYEIYAAEKGASGFPHYAVDSKADYFAECVWKALVNPNWCQQTIPRSYNYVMRYVNMC